MLSILLSMLGKILTYSLVLAVGTWCWFQWSNRDLIRSVSKVPVQLIYLPILGHTHYTMQGMEAVARYAVQMSIDGVTKGLHTICFWCGPLPIVMIHGMDDIQKVLNSSVTSEKGNEMNYMKWSLGNGLLTAPGDIWKTTRRHFNPLFHPRNVEQLMPMFNKNSRELVSILSEHVGRGPVNVMETVMDVALKSVCNLIFGHEFDCDIKSPGFIGLRKTVELFPELVAKRIVRLWLRSDAIFEFLYKKEIREIKESVKKFTEDSLKLAEVKKPTKSPQTETTTENNLDGNAPEAEGPLTLLNVYNVLQQNSPTVSDSDLHSEMMTLYVTGTDTVSAGVSSCILALAKYPDMQERLYQEISSVVGPGDDVTQEDLNRMPYLEQVYKETLRWATIIPYIVRKPSEDIQLSSCKVPAGNTIILGLLGIHMDPKIHPNPQRFDPERFSPENMADKERYSFLPFSGGPRNCIGKSYNQLLLKTMVVQLLRKYKFTTAMDIYNMKKKFMVTLISAEGYNVSLQLRSQVQPSSH